MAETLRQFIEYYYIQPITHDTGYNPVNTITWAIVLVIFLFLTFKLLRRLEIEIKPRFITAVAPYVIVGASLRVMEDAELFTPPLNYLLITPLIFFLVFFCCLALLFLSLFITRLARPKKYEYTHVFGLIGMLWCFVNLAVLLRYEHVAVGWVLFAVIGIAGVLVSIIYAIAAKFGISFLTDKLNGAVLGAHLLDASSSFIGIDMLGYTGKHVIEGLIVEYTGTAAGMFPLKLGVLVPLLYVLDTQFRENAEERELKNIVLLALLVIGLAPAVRNTLRMVLGV